MLYTALAPVAVLKPCAPKIVNDIVQNIQDDQLVLEFYHGFAGLYPELKEGFQQLYANLLNKN